MRIFTSILFVTLAFLFSAKAYAHCPDPLFNCPEPGTVSPTPSPPDPLFSPVNIGIENLIDFNKNHGVIKNGKIEIRPYVPHLTPEMKSWLEENQDYIDANALYVFSPDSIQTKISTQANNLDRKLIVGGGVLLP